MPKTEITDGGSQFSLTVPPLPSAGIELHAPELLTGIGVAGATLTPLAKDAPGISSGELTQVDHLTVRWPRMESKTSALQGLTVTELSWLHVDTAEIKLETKYVIEGGARRPEKLRINYDDRWEPETIDNSATAQQSQNNSTGPRSIQIPLPAEDIDRQEVSIHWKLTGAPLTGNFRLPPIELASVPVSQHWFAVSADPSLQCSALDNAAPGATPKEFLAKWGSSPNDTPQIVRASSAPNPAMALSVRPRESESVVREVLHIAAGRQALRIVYRANVTPGNQYRFQYRLAVPANLTVDEIALNAADRQIPTRWSLDSDNHVNIFFSEEAKVDFRLTVSGRLPIESGEKTVLPRVTSASTASAAQQVQIYRDDDVHVDLQGLPPAEESSTGPNDLPPVQWLVRPLGVYQLDEAAAKAARIAAEPSQPKLTGDTLTTLTREADTWRANFRCRLVAENGDVDMLRLRVPSTWTGPFEIESNVPVVTDIAPLDDLSHNLSIRFASTIVEGNPIEFQIRGPARTRPARPPPCPISPSLHFPAGIATFSSRSHSIRSRLPGTKWASDKRAFPQKLLPATVDIAKQRQLEVIRRSLSCRGPHGSDTRKPRRESASPIRRSPPVIAAEN